MPIWKHSPGAHETDPTPSPVHSPPLVGRAEELRTLLDTVANPPSVALVEGEAGIGKSRLVRELLGHPTASARNVLVGWCHPIREPFPYGPVLELLRQADQQYPHPEHLNPVTGALRPYLPELGSRLPPALDVLPDPRAERHRLFRAVRELLTALGSCVLVVEDLHWADDGTRDLLRFLVDQPPDQLTVVLSYRREDLPGAGLPLGQAYRPAPQVASALISLSPLDLSSVQELTAAVLGRQDIPAEVVARLHERTAGIPLVLEEVVRGLTDSATPFSGDGGVAALDEMEVPLLLREAMVERLAPLPAPTVEMVHAAAVLRMPATEDLIAAVAGMAADEGSDAVKLALQSGVLREFDGGRYGFRHMLAQQAVDDSLSGPDRRELHRRAVRALRTAQPTPWVQLAYHARQARDTDAWLRYSEAAADNASEVGDTAISVEVLEGVLSEEELPDAARGRLALKLSRVAVVGMSHRRAVRLLRRILQSDDLPAGIRGEVRLNLGLLLANQAGETSSGRADMEVAVEELHERPSLAARGMAALAHPAAEGIPLAEHEGWMARAEHLVSRQDNPVLATAVLANRATLLMNTGAPDAWTVAERLPAQTRSVRERQQVARGYGNLADACTWLGHYQAAEDFLRRGERLADDSGASVMTCMVEGTQLRLDFEVGHWVGLADRARRLVDTTADTPLIAADGRLVLGLLARTRGEWEEGWEQLAATRASGVDRTAAPVNAVVSGTMIRMLLVQGDTDAACAEVDLAVARMRRKGNWLWAAELVPPAVEALSRAGRVEDAQRLVEDFTSGVKGRDAPLARAALHSCRGTLAGVTRQHHAAVEAFTEARACYQRLPNPYSAANAGESALHGRLAIGDREAGHELVGMEEEFEALGATWDAARCRRALRDTGIVAPSRRGRKGYGGELSPREREVARLVALGKTNRQIAEVLFLSPRTVEQHVAQVLRKLGVNSRDEIVELSRTRRGRDITESSEAATVVGDPTTVADRGRLPPESYSVE